MLPKANPNGMLELLGAGLPVRFPTYINIVSNHEKSTRRTTCPLLKVNRSIGGLAPLLLTNKADPSGAKDICAGPFAAAGGVVRSKPNDLSLPD